MAVGLVEGIWGGDGESEGAALERPASEAFAAALAPPIRNSSVYCIRRCTRCFGSRRFFRSLNS